MDSEAIFLTRPFVNNRSFWTPALREEDPKWQDIDGALRQGIEIASTHNMKALLLRELCYFYNMTFYPDKTLSVEPELKKLNKAESLELARVEWEIALATGPITALIDPALADMNKCCELAGHAFAVLKASGAPESFTVMMRTRFDLLYDQRENPQAFRDPVNLQYLDLTPLLEVLDGTV